MTTPQTIRFNPGLALASPDDRQQNQQSQKEIKEYPVTGNTSRDSVRKMIYELFQGDAEVGQEHKFTISQIVEQLEDDIFSNIIQ